MVLAKGADVNAVDQDGRTVLHLAALRGHKEVVGVLLAKGASKTVRDRDWKTPYDSADNPDIKELLK